MLTPGNILTTVKNRRGSTAVIVAICLVMLIGFAALAVDLGYLYATRNELQNVADAGALAGAGYLGSVYATLSFSDQQNKVFTFEEVATAVNQVTEKNKAAGVNIYIRGAETDGDIVIGTGEWVDEDSDGKDEFKITPTLITPDAVQVTARRDSNINNPVSTFFARIFKLFGADFDTVIVRAVATAALTGPANVEEGELKTPFGLSECVFPDDCDDFIRFSPTTNSCAAWHNFFDDANTNDLSDKLINLIQGDSYSYDDMLSGSDWLSENFYFGSKTPVPMVTPETSSGDFFNFSGQQGAAYFVVGEMLHPITEGGNIDIYYGIYTDKYGDPDYKTEAGTKAPVPIRALFDYFRYRDDDGDNDKWTATVPIYKDDVCCINASGSIEIVGFAFIEIYMPNPPPDNTIDVWVPCEQLAITGRGGGGISGNLKGIIPNLVK